MILISKLSSLISDPDTAFGICHNAVDPDIYVKLAQMDLCDCSRQLVNESFVDNCMVYLDNVATQYSRVCNHIGFRLDFRGQPGTGLFCECHKENMIYF